jgi:hypothetical protein
MEGDAPQTGSAPLPGARPVDPLALPQADWLRHDLVVTGPRRTSPRCRLRLSARVPSPGAIRISIF